MVGKRDRIAGWLQASGLLSALAALPQRHQLLVLNYHRIGDHLSTPFDAEVFSATAEEFDRQIRFLAEFTHPISLHEAVAMANGEPSRAPSKTNTLITFDDGYLDNFEIAFPILRRHGVQGVFFLPTSLVGSRQVPWWDLVAYTLKHAPRRDFTLRYPLEKHFSLATLSPEQISPQVLALYKHPEMLDSERFFSELTEASAAVLPDIREHRLFLNWDEARQMVKGGMAIGAHTHSHEILGRLPEDRQAFELAEGKRILERHLQIPIDTIAYPVGNPGSFTALTARLARREGYRAGFSYYGGLNRSGQMDPYNVLRAGATRQGCVRFEAQVTCAATLGHFWP